MEIGEFDIERAEINFSPSEIMRKREETVVITLMDTAGEPLAGYGVTNTLEHKTKETNSEGRTGFEIKTGEERVPFEIETDVEIEGYEFMGRNLTAKDVDSPVLYYPNTVDEPTATIEIFDPSEVAQVFLDGRIQDIYVSEEVEHEVELEPGENIFEIFASDVHGHSTREEVVIEYDDTGGDEDDEDGADIEENSAYEENI